MEVAVERGGGLQVRPCEGSLQQSPRLFGLPSLQGDLGCDAPEERPLLRRSALRQLQAAADVRVGVIEPAGVHLGGGKIAEEAGFKRSAAHLAGDLDGRVEGGDGLGVAAERLVGVGLVVQGGDQQHRLGLIRLGRLGVVFQHPLVVPGVLVDRAEVLQRLGLAARVVGGAEEVEGGLIVLQRLSDVAEDGHGVAVGGHQLGVQLVLRGALFGHLQSLPDDGHGFLGVAGAHQRLGLEPLRRGGAQGGVPGSSRGQRQGLVRRCQGFLRIAHHGGLGPVDGGVEGRCRRADGVGRSQGRRRRGGGQGPDQPEDARLHPNSPTGRSLAARA